MSAGEVIASYHDPWQVVASFRMSKTDLRARPMFHHTREAIEAHLTIVFTALAVSREVRNRTGLAIRRPHRGTDHHRRHPGQGAQALKANAAGGAAATSTVRGVRCGGAADPDRYQLGQGKIECTDRYRLASFLLDGSGELPEVSVPATPFAKMLKATTGDEVLIGTVGERVSVHADNIRFTIRAIDGVYPKVDKKAHTGKTVTITAGGHKPTGIMSQAPGRTVMLQPVRVTT